MSSYNLLSPWSFLKTNNFEKSSWKTFRMICILGTIVFFMYVFTRQQKVPIQSPSLQVWYTEEQKRKPATYINLDHGFCGPCPIEQQLSNAWRLTDILTFFTPSNPFLVNIGAASNGGGKYDPTQPVLAAVNSSFGALLIDPHTDPGLFNAYPDRPNIRIVHNFSWSESIVQDIFEKNNLSKNFTILKVDVDSYDCTLIETILRANYRPQLIHSEFNPIFPPPVIFMPIYDPATKNDWVPELWNNVDVFYGCSLSALSKILKSFDYILLEVDFWDVIYIQRKLAESAHIQVPANDDIAYQYGFSNHLCLPYCRGNQKLYNQQIEIAIKVALNQSNFTEYMRNILDSAVPGSTKHKFKHPYIISL